MTGCQFMWNVDTNQYKIISIFPVTELSEEFNAGAVEDWSPTWNPTRNFISTLRKTIKQIYARPVRYIHHSAGFSGLNTNFYYNFLLINAYTKIIFNRFTISNN